MTQSVHFEDAASIADLTVFLERSLTTTDGVVRVTAGCGTLRTTVCTFMPFGLLDTAPTVLGMRVFAESSGFTGDFVLSARAVLDRLARIVPTTPELVIPPTRETAVWVGVEPPQNDWKFVASIAGAMLRARAETGITEVSESLPANAGEPIVREVRNSVWSRPMPEAHDLPSSAAFTAHILGFLQGNPSVRFFESGRWMRLSSPHGHVLIYQR